ncbi:MAG: PQQ-binding-like beta-propeller repeat protein, partial [Pirellulaceae bacterium]
PIPVDEGKFLIGASDGRGEQTAGNAAASNGLIEIKPTQDGRFEVDFAWRADKATSSFGSPAVANGKVWIVNRSGVLFQLDLATGKQLSAERIAAGSIWATPLF